MTRATFRTAALGVLLFAAGRLGAAVLNVPADHPTITAAVSRAADGDTVLVEDGVYLESNIEITKRLLVRSRNRYGAVIYGSERTQDAVFIIRAAARLEGFILKNAAAGIKQRRSLDVEWQVSNVAIFNCSVGIALDDLSANIGSARIRNVAVFGGPESVGISTNDAGRIEVADCLIANCGIAFQGYDHLSFRVSGGAVVDCGRVIIEATAHRPIPPATSRVEIGGGLRVLRTDSMKGPGRLEESLGYLRTSVFGAQDREAGGGAGMLGRASMIALAEAGMMLRMGEHGLAGGRYMRALETARKAGMDELAWLAIMGLARTAGSGGKTAEALGHYREAVDLLEKWIPAVPMGLRRIDFLEDKASAFEAVIGLSLDEHASDPAGGHAEQAFLYAERLKSLTRFFPPDARGRGPAAGAASKAISSLQLRLQDPDLGAEAKEELIRGLERAEEDYQAALIDEERAWTTRKDGPTAPADNGERLPSPLGFRGVKDRLAGRAVLSYVLGEDGSYAFLATGAGLSWARLPGESRIAGMVDPYLRFLQLRDGNEFRGARAGRLLFDLLIGPFSEKLRAGPRQIIVVPDGWLSYLPFEALVVSGGDDRIKPVFWGESAEISYAPSATRAVNGRPWGAAGAMAEGSAPGILAVGCSDGIRCDNRSRKLKRSFLPLAHVRREIRALAGYFPARKVTTLIDAEAGEAGLRSADLTRYGIVHFAVHGVIDDTDWWRSALLLRPDPGRGDDGFFTALEISELELEASLVVLSGCGTGAGGLHKGEGIRGLSGAFLRAGAEYLVVSLWNVDDRATAELMGRFYRELAAGASPARALAAAKKQMIGTGYRNPFFWAPFVLIKNGEDPGRGREGTLPTALLIR